MHTDDQMREVRVKRAEQAQEALTGDIVVLENQRSAFTESLSEDMYPIVSLLSCLPDFQLQVRSLCENRYV
jgi:hypothetical protein